MIYEAELTYISLDNLHEVRTFINYTHFDAVSRKLKLNLLVKVFLHVFLLFFPFETSSFS